MRDPKTRQHGAAGDSPFRAVVLAAGLAVLAACSSGYEKIEPQTYDTEFDIFSVIGWSGNLDIFLIKAFESDGMVALCGGYTRGTSNFATIGNRRWADISQVYIDGQKIGTGEFMAQLPVNGFKRGEDPKPLFLALQERQPEVPCVRSRVPWKAEYGAAKIERRGATKITVED